MSSEITTLSPTAMQFAPSNWRELMTFAEVMAKSTAVPKCYQGDPGAIIFAVQMGAEVGLGPGQSLQSIANIEGSLRMWGDTPLAIVQSSGLLEWYEETNNYDPPQAPRNGTPEEIAAWKASLAGWKEPAETAWYALCTIKRKGEEVYSQRYSYDDAKRAGLWGRQSSQGKAMPWTTSPKRLMKYRARAFALRDKFSDVLKGIHSKEEFGDEYGGDATPRNVTDTGAPRSGNDVLRATLAASMGAGAIKPEEPPPVDETIPPFQDYSAPMVQSKLEGAAIARGLEAPDYKKLVLDTLGDRKLTKATAAEVWMAIHAWKAPVTADDSDIDDDDRASDADPDEDAAP